MWRCAFFIYLGDCCCWKVEEIQFVATRTGRNVKSSNKGACFGDNCLRRDFPVVSSGQEVKGNPNGTQMANKIAYSTQNDKNGL